MEKKTISNVNSDVAGMSSCSIITLDWDNNKE